MVDDNFNRFFSPKKSYAQHLFLTLNGITSKIKPYKYMIFLLKFHTVENILFQEIIYYFEIEIVN